MYKVDKPELVIASKWQMETNQSIRGSGHTNLSKIAPDIQQNNHKIEEWLRNL